MVSTEILQGCRAYGAGSRSLVSQFSFECPIQNRGQHCIQFLSGLGLQALQRVHLCLQRLTRCAISFALAPTYVGGPNDLSCQIKPKETTMTTNRGRNVIMPMFA